MIFNESTNTMSKSLPISVCMLILNEEDRLKKTLPKLSQFAEIIVFDSGSTDDSVRLCKDANALVFQTQWEGFGKTRKKLFEAAKQPWILWLDADEIITDKLSKELEELFKNKPSFDAYRINRMVFFLGRWIKHGDWFPDWNTRLFKNDVWDMDDSEVHERLKISGSIARLNGRLEHHSFRDWDDYKKRCERYSQLWAKQKKLEGKTASHFDPLSHAIWSFLRSYFIKRGFFDGAAGFKIAMGNASAVHRKYALLRADT
jgi:(heptosyl)LPS beta-1,4-glucosyltransferase